LRWELGGMPSHTNQHYISAGPFLGGFLFNRRLPSLSPGLPRPGLFVVGRLASLFVQHATNELLDRYPKELVTMASFHFLIDCSVKPLQ